jgi:uncharacterized membrane protein
MKATVLRLFGVNADEVRRVTSVTLHLRNIDWLGWLFFGAMLLGAFVWWSYWRQEAHRALPAWKRRLLAGLRFTLFALLLLLLLRPVLALEMEENIRRTVVLLVDSTKSMNIRDQRTDDADLKRAQIGIGAINSLDQPLDTGRADAAAHISRAELVKAVLGNDHLHLLDDLKKDFNVETWLFGQTAAPVDGPGWLADYHPASNTTAIGDALAGVLERKRGQPVAGIVLITDGGNNAGSPPAEAAEAANRDGVPVYAYGVGITSPRDIDVSHLSAPEIVFAKDDVAATVQVRGQGLAGVSARLSLKLGDEEVGSQNVVFTGGDQTVTVNFTPQKKGDYELTASIPPRDDEASKENNSTGQHVRVVDDKIKVLYIEQAPRWEFRFVEEALLRDRRIQASFVLVEGDPDISRGAGTPYLPAFPDQKEALFKYDMVIVGDVDPQVFKPGQLDAISEFVSKFGGACMFIAGKSFMPEAYRGGVVEQMLPVELEPFRESGREGDRPIQLALTPLGEASQMLRMAPDEQENATLWSKLPPIYWDFKVARSKPAAQVLVEDPDPARASLYGHMPVLATQQYGVGQVFYLGTDDLWRWRQGPGVNEYPLLWGQMVQGAALAHLLGNSKKTQLSVDKEQHSVGDPVTVFARLYNDSFLPISDSQVPAQYTVQAGQTGSSPGEKTEVVLRAVPDQPGMYRGDFVALTAGRYRFSTVRDPATAVEFTATEPQFELGETAMNEGLLKQIAAISGGHYFREENLADLARELNAEPETLRTARDVEVWASPFYFLLMCMVAATEWVLRKRWDLK